MCSTVSVDYDFSPLCAVGIVRVCAFSGRLSGEMPLQTSCLIGTHDELFVIVPLTAGLEHLE